jgi:hypothetical protein
MSWQAERGTVLPKAAKVALLLAIPPLEANQIEVMQSVLKYATTLAAIGVFLVLLAGFWNMMRGSNPNLSQKLMRWRVGLQFLAIMIAMILVYLMRP